MRESKGDGSLLPSSSLEYQLERRGNISFSKIARGKSLWGYKPPILDNAGLFYISCIFVCFYCSSNSYQLVVRPDTAVPEILTTKEKPLQPVAQMGKAGKVGKVQYYPIYGEIKVQN